MFGTSIESCEEKYRSEGRIMTTIDLIRTLYPFALIPNTLQHLTASASTREFGEDVYVRSNPAGVINLVITS